MGRTARLAAVLAGALTMLSCSAPATPPPTVRVDRGLVATTVSASGSLVSLSEQNLGFTDGGKLVELLVKVGDRVEPEQVLARVDDAALRQTLAQQQAQLGQQQALLDKLTGSNSVQAAQATLDQARDTLASTRQQVDATNRSNRSATDQASKQLGFDRAALRDARSTLREDRSDCSSASRSSTTTAQTTAPSVAPTSAATSAPTSGATQPPATPAPTSTAPPSSGPPATTVAPTSTPRPSSTRPSTTTPRTSSRTSTRTSTRTSGSSARPASFRHVLAVGSVPAVAGVPAVGAIAATTADTTCDQERSSESAVQEAERTVLASETALRAAKQQEQTDAAAGRVTIDNAETSVVTAQNELGTARNDQPADTRAQAALVRDAQATVALAQIDLDETVLRAPVGGTVSSINGVVGEVVAAASGTTALAPNSSARLPGLADTAAASTSGTSTPGGGAFMVLEDVQSFQLVVPFEESDAVRVLPNQRVDVSVDAIPDLTRQGTVLAVGPSGESDDGIINYYATVVLAETDPRLRDGQTAEAEVVVDSVDNVLRVPSSAVRTEDGRSVVTTPGEDGAVKTSPFLPGRVGDEFTEVRGGLRLDEEVILPDAQVTASEPRGGPPN